MNGLRVDDVSRSFVSGGATKAVLEHLSFDVGQSEVVALFGPNGCGKSTLFQILAGLDVGYVGSVSLSERPLESARIGYIFQNFSASLFPWLTLAENIAFPQQLRAQARDPRSADEDPQAILGRFELQDFGRHYPYQVSGGMQQRVCFGRALATPQDLLLLDEPFSALDARGFGQILNAFESRSGRSPALLVCHDLDQAMVFSDRVLVLSPRPARIVRDARVPFGRPRALSLLLDLEFQELRREIMAARLEAENTDPALGQLDVGGHRRAQRKGGT